MMKDKKEISTAASTTTSVASQLSVQQPNFIETQNPKASLWSALNFAVVATTTSAAIVAVQSPIKTIILNLTTNNSFLPSYSGGVFAMARVLYKGTASSLSGSAVRTAYVTGAKNNKPTEGVSEALIKEEGQNKPSAKVKMAYVMSMAFGEILVTQIPESLSQLQKIKGLITNDFKWYASGNPVRLMTGGFIPRYTAGMVNFASMCMLVDVIAPALPIENTNVQQFAAGGLSGMAAATISYPFTVFKDYVLVQATVTCDGKLVNKSSVSALKEIGNALVADPKKAIKSALGNAVKQLPVRVGLTGAIFSMVAGIGNVLGDEPLAKVVPKRYQPYSEATNPKGFFSGSNAKAKISEVVASEDVVAETGEAPKPK